MVRPHGFTLIEIMVVMLIIGVILSIAIPAININNPEDKLQEETTRLAALIDLASQESILNSRAIGIRTDSDQYEFLVLEEDKWKSLDDKLLTKRKLPEDIELELQVEDYSTPGLSDSEEQQKIPHIIVSGIGELTPPFTINIKSHTLMEVLVSLAVLAIALSALVKSSGENTSNMEYLRDKTFAHWVAMNKATELRVNKVWASTGNSNGSAEMASRQWHWTMKVEATPDKAIRKYILEIRKDSHDDNPIARLAGFMNNPDG